MAMNGRGEQSANRADNAGQATTATVQTATAALTAPEPAQAARSAGPSGPRPDGAAASPARAVNQRRVNKKIVFPLLAAGVIAGVLFGYTYWRDQSLYVSTNNAQITGALVQVGSVNAGRIADVTVDVGTNVLKDQQIGTIMLPTTLTVTSGGVPRLGFRGTDDERVPVTAPADGLVVLRSGNPGDTVPAGQPIVTIVDPSRLWVQAQIEETKIDSVHVGQAVDVHVDTLGKTLPGRVEAVDGAIAASFSLLPQGTTSGNFTKVTQLVPVKIAVDYGKDRLLFGSSVEVKIHKQQ